MNYEEISHLIKPGDVFAFCGIGGFSDIIKPFTNCNVSHVGIILNNAFNFNQIMESATIGDKSGVSINFVRDRLKTYHGLAIWWAPLNINVRAKFDEEIFYDFMMSQNGKPYDIEQVFFAGIDIFDSIGFMKNKENYEKFFCSEIVAAGLKVGIGLDINPSEYTPLDVCHMDVLGKFTQLVGEPMDIEPFTHKNSKEE